MIKRIIWAMITLVATIFLSALGNAVWEYLLKPMLPSIGHFTIDVATLGLQSVRDQMYVEVAKGNYERAAIADNAFLTAFLLTPVFIALTGAILIPARVRIRSFFRGDAASGDGLSSRARAALITSLVILGIVGCTIILGLARTIYIVRAANNLDQFQRVVAPYISADRRLLLSSKIAQIETESDYRGIVKDLTVIAQANHLVVPTFDIK
jgi:hypothetical protein